MTESLTGEAEALFAVLRQSADVETVAAIERFVAALRMREAMRDFNADHGYENLLLKIGIHEGPCLAVVLNERQDYFRQTVNIAARVQGLAESRAIYATGPVVDHPGASQLLAASGLAPLPQDRMLRGIPGAFAVYEIP